MLLKVEVWCCVGVCTCINTVLLLRLLGYWVCHLTEWSGNLFVSVVSAHAQAAGHFGFKLLCVVQNLCIVVRIQLTVMWVLYFPFSGQGTFGIIWGAQGLQFSERQCYWPLKGLCFL